MPKQKKPEEVPAGAPMWMATFGDLMSLLLTFFILLLSFSTIQDEDFEKAMGSLQGALGTLRDPFDQFNVINDQMPRPVTQRFQMIRHGKTETEKTSPESESDTAAQSEEATFELSQFAHENGVSKLMSVELTSRGFKIRLPTILLFDKGHASIKTSDKTKKILNKITQVLKGLTHYITISGHTDNRQIHSEFYSSNWKLSSDRAISVLEELTKRGIHQKQMEAVAKASFTPFASNETIRGRKLNRRVEIEIDLTRGVY